MFKCHGLINISDNLIKRNNYLLKCGKIPNTFNEDLLSTKLTSNIPTVAGEPNDIGMS